VGIEPTTFGILVHGLVFQRSYRFFRKQHLHRDKPAQISKQITQLSYK
jgi:hypothetical protein